MTRSNSHGSHIEIRNLAYLFYGFSVVWVIVLIYVFTLSRREKNLRDEMNELKKSVEEEMHGQGSK